MLFWKDCSCVWLQCNIFFFFRSCRRGSLWEARFGMNLPSWFTNPMNCWRSFIFSGFGNFLTASVFSESGCIVLFHQWCDLGTSQKPLRTRTYWKANIHVNLCHLGLVKTDVVFQGFAFVASVLCHWLQLLMHLRLA